MRDAVTETIAELREFVKKNDGRVFSFCYFMMAGDISVEEVAVGIFREFGGFFRQIMSGRHRSHGEPMEFRIRLFQIAWAQVRNALSHPHYPWATGRDTRLIKKWEEDLLGEGSQPESEPLNPHKEGIWLDRISGMDPELRAPLVLRDILKFDDEEVSRILNLRWGIYRQRLHRGRMDLKDRLRGKNPFQSGRVATGL